MVSEEEGTTTADDSLSENDPAATELSSMRLSARDRRKQTLLFLCFGTTLIVVAGLWWYDYFEMPVIVQEPLDPPSVRFERLCEAVRDEGGKKLHIEGFPVDDSMISRIGELQTLDTLIIDEGIVTDETIDLITQLSNLQHLRLRLSPIGDQGLKQLASCDNLWFLNLPHSVCTAKGVASLASLKNLRQIRLGSKELDNQVTAALAKIQSLRGIHLIGVPITDEGLKKLAAMPYLESLYLDDSAVTAAGWEWLFREHSHLHVHIDQYHHDRDPKAHVHHDL